MPYGILQTLDGPAPLAPAYGLVDSMRIVPTGDDYWLNGITPWLYPSNLPGTYDPCATGSQAGPKSSGAVLTDPNASNTFGAFVVYSPETCTAYRMMSVEGEFIRRAQVQLDATESWAVGREFEQGLRVPANPYLSKAGAQLAAPAQTPVTPRVGLGYLERAIANTARAGVIHAPVEIVTAWSALGHVFEDNDGLLKTKAKLTPVVCDSGYQGVAPSDATSQNTGTQLCAYATGSVDIYRSEIFVVPDDISEALDRGSNTVVYRAERYYAYDFDATLLRAWVRIDWTT